MATEFDEAAFVAEDEQAQAVEEREVREWVKAWERARDLDRPARAQYALDRRYAAGTANPDKAVTTNLVGNYIDILVDYLYARNPDVSCRPAEEVMSAMPEEPLVPPSPPDPADPLAVEQFVRAQAEFEQARAARAQQELARRQARAERQDLAATLQIVIAKLWKRGKLKKAVRRQVRSVLSTGVGWIKALMIVDTAKDPQIQQQLNDLRDNLARIAAKRKELEEAVPEDLELAERELQEQIDGLEPRLEVIVSKTFVVDFCPAETVQVSTDVAYLDDYLDASWIGNVIYVRKSDLRAMFPRLTDEEIKGATTYYMRSPRESLRPDEAVEDMVPGLGEFEAARADLFVSSKGSGSGDEESEPFAAVVEIWDRKANNIKTMVEGVKRWAREPYQPRFATSRYYPYFYLAFYDVDGQRHPQSMSQRLAKLQDEYEDTRSKFRLTRKRATPGVLFHKGQVSAENARDIERATEQEYVGIDPTNPAADLNTLFAPKPIAVGDMGLYDTSAIIRDMEKISGVQEALQSSAARRPSKTATEAEIEQSGFSQRVQADQDSIDEMLTELAQYTAELALQALTGDEVRRIAGLDAFWPEPGTLPLEDLTSLVEVDIEAGSTGRPNRSSERQAWATMLPMIRQDIIQIQQARMSGNEPLAKALIALLQETFRVMGGRGNVERFIPEPAPVMGPMAPALPAPATNPGLGGGGVLPAELPPEEDDTPPNYRTAGRAL
ncbi:MAG: hypothetical protein C0P74_015040 [Gammaproteobacteria bacterium]